MLTLRPSDDRGHFDHGWLDTRHTFSFGDYHDPQQMGFRSLRVINEDRVLPGQGFGMHGHRDMEIITYVVAGQLEHRDSLGTGEVITPGQFQRMTAGTGIRHSEFNPSETTAVHLLQIWILPSERGLEPSYEQKAFPPRSEQPLRLVVSPDGAEGSLRMNQDARLYHATLAAGQSAELNLAPNRHAWVQVVSGSIEANGQTLSAGDGAAVSEETLLQLTAGDAGADALLFDLS